MDSMAKSESSPSGRGRAGRTLLGRPWLMTIVMASALCLAYLVGVVVNWTEEADRSLFANLGMIPIGLVATILALKASGAQADCRFKWAWRLLGAGLACFFAGDVLFFVYQNIIGSSPFPSLADAGYLAYYPLVFAGLLCIPSLPERRQRPIIPYLDCALVILGGASVILYVFLLPTLQASHDQLFAYALSVGYPVGDIFLLAGVAWVLLRRVPGRPRSIFLLSAGLIVGLAADVIYGYQSTQGTFQSGGLPDAAYMVSWTLFAWAGFAEVACNRHRSTRGPGRSTRWLRVLLPCCSAALGVGLLLLLNRDLLGQDEGVVVLVAAGLIVLSTLRQALTIRTTSRYGTPQDRRSDDRRER